MQLEDLFVKYGTDKGNLNGDGWGYTEAYEIHLNPIRHRVRNVLEIGICGYRNICNNVVGASLFAWRDFFPNAMIHGLDNDSRFIFNDQVRIKTALCNAYKTSDLRGALAEFGDPAFDFICDDAVHDPMPQVQLALNLLPHLSPGGVYAIEDVCPPKCLGGDIEIIASALIAAHPDLLVSEYQTHKEERLLILRKPA